jgi:hypothetical protein
MTWPDEYSAPTPFFWTPWLVNPAPVNSVAVLVHPIGELFVVVGINGAVPAPSQLASQG